MQTGAYFSSVRFPAENRAISTPLNESLTSFLTERFLPVKLYPFTFRAVGGQQPSSDTGTFVPQDRDQFFATAPVARPRLDILSLFFSIVKTLTGLQDRILRWMSKGSGQS